MGTELVAFFANAMAALIAALSPITSEKLLDLCFYEQDVKPDIFKLLLSIALLIDAVTRAKYLVHL